jgi:hypothetical protein
MGLKFFQLRLTPEVINSIKSLTSNPSAWIREAIEEGLLRQEQHAET